MRDHVSSFFPYGPHFYSVDDSRAGSGLAATSRQVWGNQHFAGKIRVRQSYCLSCMPLLPPSAFTRSRRSPLQNTIAQCPPWGSSGSGDRLVGGLIGACCWRGKADAKTLCGDGVRARESLGYRQRQTEKGEHPHGSSRARARDGIRTSYCHLSPITLRAMPLRRNGPLGFRNYRSSDVQA